MSLQPVQLPQPLLLVPPLVLRTRNGFFGAKRFGPGEFDRCRPCTCFRAPAEPPAPPPVRYLKQQVHEGVDLEGEAGDCVFAAYIGRVVEVEVGAGGRRGNVTIDHHPFGTGLVSSYLHLEGGSLCVEEGDVVTKGQVIGRIGGEPEDPHLHFALRIVVDPSDNRYWTDRSSVALDPTRLLYRLEADDVEVPVLSAAAAAVTSIGVEEVDNVPLFRAWTGASPGPLCHPAVRADQRARARHGGDLLQGAGAGPPGRGRLPRLGVLRPPPGPGRRPPGLSAARRRQGTYACWRDDDAAGHGRRRWRVGALPSAGS